MPWNARVKVSVKAASRRKGGDFTLVKVGDSSSSTPRRRRSGFVAQAGPLALGHSLRCGRATRWAARAGARCSALHPKTVTGMPILSNFDRMIMSLGRER
jgi:hypothetical protein